MSKKVCPNCGYCKECGRGPTVTPFIYPYYPYTPAHPPHLPWRITWGGEGSTPVNPTVTTISTGGTFQ